MVYRFLFILCIAFVSMGCGDHWQTTKPLTNDPATIMNVCQNSLTNFGYTISHQEPNYCQTEWQNHLQPFRPGGYRLQACIHIIDVARNTYQVQLQVKRQRNHSTHDSFHPLQARFLPDGYDLKQEQLLSDYITSKLSF